LFSTFLQRAEETSTTIYGQIKGLTPVSAHASPSLVALAFARCAAVTLSSISPLISPIPSFQGKHGLRVLIFGDESDGFKTLGGPFNPLSAAGWALREDEDRPVGALGNIEADESGTANIQFTDRHVRLIGPLSVLGRAIAITANEDDGGKGGAAASGVDGNAGAIIAAGVIGISSSS
jgi:Cu-Zn family superoxide dismutase